MNSQPATILCVEDEPRLRANIAEELADAGYAVLEAEDGEVALGIIRSCRPDLVLCDITMPRMGGYELLHAMRKSGPDLADLPFVFLTALSERRAVIEGRMAGADDYLTKPIDFDLMLATIGSRLAQVARTQTRFDARSSDQLARLSGEGKARRLSDLQHAFDSVAFGVMLFGGEGEFLHANPLAAAVPTNVLAIQAGRLTAATQAQSRQLRAALSAAIEQQTASDLLAVDHFAGHPLLVRFVPLGAPDGAGVPCIAAFIIDANTQPPVSQAVASKLFSFTPSEARIAAAIARGQGRDEIIADLGISTTTFAFHLRNIFRKAEVNRQQDLVAILVRSTIIEEVGAILSDP